MMRKLLFCAVLLVACVRADAGQDGGEVLSHAIFVKVNGKTITQENVVEAVKFIMKREFGSKPPQSEEELENVQKAALRDLVRTILIHDEAGKEGLKPERQLNRATIAQSGLKMEEITPTIRRMLQADDLFSDLMMAEGTPILQPTPRQLRDFYNKNREQFRTNQLIIVRTIFVPFEPRRPEYVFRERAEGMMRELEAVPVDARTAAFDKMAREKSQDYFARFGGLLTADGPDRWIPREFQNKGPDGKEMLPPPWRRPSASFPARANSG